jgi:signal transduction histidine kinase/phage shock protein PspC (stress-responsive transcriptional regulator)
MVVGRANRQNGQTMTMTSQPRRAYRDPEDRFLGGVAGGLATHLGLSSLRVRVGFLVLTLLGGFGAMVYAGLWVLLPVHDPDRIVDEQPPGVSAASRRGLRTIAAPEHRRDAAVVVSLLVVFAGVIALWQGLGLGLSQRVFWPIVVGSGGLMLLWWQSDESSRTAWLTTSRGWKTWLRTLAGLLLLVAAISLAVLGSGVRGALGTALATVVLGAIGVLLVVGPWLLRTNRALRFERSERIRSQERADVAAHLHDSVLQTLALIQRQSSDPQAVARLARTQERELRRWLFESDDRAALQLSTALRDAAAEVEDAYAVPVEVVVVGDAPVGDEYAPLVAAAREALQNAAKHSGAHQVDVYVEVGGTGVEIFVRDRGVGFDPSAVPADRLGLRGSIVDRMVRHGGSADVRSQPGDGAEVRLWMPAGSSMRRSGT